MSARVWVNGALKTCRAKDPSNCPYHRGAGGKPLKHCMDGPAALADAEDQSARENHASALSKACEKKQSLAASSQFTPAPESAEQAVHADREAASERVREDDGWGQAVRKTQIWAGFDDVLDDPDYDAERGRVKASKQTALHEAAHAIMDSHGGLGVEKTQVGYQDTPEHGVTLGLTWMGRGINGSGEAIRAGWASLAGRQIDDAFSVGRHAGDGGMQSVDKMMSMMSVS